MSLSIYSHDIWYASANSNSLYRFLKLFKNFVCTTCCKYQKVRKLPILHITCHCQYKPNKISNNHDIRCTGVISDTTEVFCKFFKNFHFTFCNKHKRVAKCPRITYCMSLSI